MKLSFPIPTATGQQVFEVETGTSLYFVGANGGGKTRLAVTIENFLGDKAHRISAHRALALNPDVAKLSEAVAYNGLKYGLTQSHASLDFRSGSR